MSPLRRWLLPVALPVVFAATLAAQTTGDIVGRVTDEAGGVLPGVAVEARSLVLQGSRTAVTDATGSYRLNLLPPGDYAVSFTGQGFASEIKQGVTVGLNKDTTLNVNLR
ncbi:MAG TPA: carboxypeptidase-like regulatory domain-containing protein, partial [Thermoanaerobaculia bacterium]|nr:carboxypeptidase-like regulatory domain-containing protein [Thermoanaerobaculia bacterium]